MAVPLYQSSAVRQGLGCSLRPGGEWLTRRILELSRPEANHVLLDAGCGPGGSLALYRAYGLEKVLGIDLDPEFVAEARILHWPVLQADLCRLPLTDQSIDMVICECAWNLTPRERTLAELGRVVRPGGVLAITDIYAGKPGGPDNTWPVPCCFAGASDLTTVRSLINMAGFTITSLEDHSRLLRETAARFVFEHGSLHGFWLAVTGSAELADQACRASQATKPGLFLLIATRNTL